MLRLFVVQNLYSLSDMATRDEAIDSRAFSAFCGTDRTGQVPDGDTIGRFRRLLEKHGIQEKLFAQVRELLIEKGLLLKKGTIVDSTFIEAPSSTKNREKKRDPEAHSGKKGSTWHFGYKSHIGGGQEQRIGSHDRHDRREYQRRKRDIQPNVIYLRFCVRLPINFSVIYPLKMDENRACVRLSIATFSR